MSFFRKIAVKAIAIIVGAVIAITAVAPAASAEWVGGGEFLSSTTLTSVSASYWHPGNTHSVTTCASTCNQAIAAASRTALSSSSGLSSKKAYWNNYV
jgi:hypothetical protein